MAPQPRQDHEIGRGVEAGGQRVGHVVGIVQIDVVVDQHDQVEVLEGPEGGQRGVATHAVVALGPLRQRHHQMEPVKPARRHAHVAHDRGHRPDRLQRGHLQHVLAQHDGLAAGAVDGVVDGLVAGRDRGHVHRRGRPGGRGVADELAEGALGDALAGPDHALQHDLGVGGNVHVLRHAGRHRQGRAAAAPGRAELVAALRHERPHGRGGVDQGHVGADADRHRQVPTHLGGMVEGPAEMASVVDLDRHLVGADQLEPVEGRVAHPGEGVTHDEHAGGDEAAAVAGGVLEHGKLLTQVDLARAPHVLLGRWVARRGGLDVGADAPGQSGPQTAAVEAHGRLRRLRRGEHVADHRNVVVLDALEQQRGAGVVMLHHGRGLEVGIDGARHPGQQPGPVETAQGGPETRVENADRLGRGHGPSPSR